MSIVGRILFQEIKYRLQYIQKLHTLGIEKSNFGKLGAVANTSAEYEEVNEPSGVRKKPTRMRNKSSDSFNPEMRFIYPEFLPDPRPQFRNTLRERLERKDMLARRTLIDIPEFYVGSIMAVTYSDIHATGKSNRFVGICIQRIRCGLRASFMLRNIVDEQGVELCFDIYDPCIHKIDCLRLEKRLDDHLRYLRDAPPEYSTFPFDLEPELKTERKEVPVNKLKVPLMPQPWKEKYELQNLKGVKEDTIIINQNRTRKAKIAAKPWEKYDLMKIYRATIPEEEQREIFEEITSELHHIEVTRTKQKRSRIFARPKKTA